LEPNFIRSGNKQIVCKKYFDYLFNQNTKFYMEVMMPLLVFTTICRNQ